MTDKSKVKVIKKSAAVAPAVKPISVKSTRVAAREMVSNVTEWVTEFKSRRSDETRAAFDQLFSKQARPSET
ncbi:MAG: hypothetical protein ABJA02_01975 [Acidobacteriota bacterium]